MRRRHDEDIRAMEEKREAFAKGLEEQMQMREAEKESSRHREMEDRKCAAERRQIQERKEEEEQAKEMARKKTIAEEMRQAATEKQRNDAALALKQRLSRGFVGLLAKYALR